MNRRLPAIIKTVTLNAVALAFMLAAAPSQARVDFSVNLGAPGYYAPVPVYAPPPAVYVEQRYYAPPPPPPPVVFYDAWGYRHVGPPPPRYRPRDDWRGDDGPRDEWRREAWRRGDWRHDEGRGRW